MENNHLFGEFTEKEMNNFCEIIAHSKEILSEIYNNHHPDPIACTNEIFLMIKHIDFDNENIREAFAFILENIFDANDNNINVFLIHMRFIKTLFKNNLED